MSKLVVGLLVIGSLGLAIFICSQGDDSSGHLSGHFGRTEQLYLWSGIIGAIVACLLLGGVGLRAASGISGERERNTWDGLLTTPLESSSILWAKWLGSMASVRWGVIWLALIWGGGVAVGGLHWLAIPLLILTWGVYAAA